jgi:LacI family transcriptional regulator
MTIEQAANSRRPGRRTTIKDVAAAAGVSVVTVSRVVNTPDQVQSDTRERVMLAMRQLGYSLNLAARSMRTQSTRSIGFLTPRLSSLSNAAVAQACERALAEAGYAMLVTSSDYQPAREAAALELLRSRGVDGIVLYVSDESHAGLARSLAGVDVPLVVLDRNLRVTADLVLSEHAGAMQEAVHHLAGLGHERLALVQHTQRVRPTVERARSFRKAAASAGLQHASVVRLPRVEGFEPTLPESLFVGPLAPTGLLVEGALLLRVVLQALRKNGLKVPKDRSVIGIDTLEVSSLTTPETTTIARDFIAVGRTAADLMLRRLRERTLPPQTVTLPSRVEWKGSCAAALSGPGKR